MFLKKAPRRFHLPVMQVLLAAATSLTVLALHGGVAHAATTWNISPGSACTLANAIIASNTNAAAGSCAPGSGGGTINMASGTYNLPGNLPAISTYPLTIKGTGPATTTINGQGLYNVIYDTNSATLVLENLTITRAGGGNGYAGLIFGGGSMVNNVAITSPTAGGLYFGTGAGSTVTVHNLAVTNAGGSSGLSINISGGTVNITNTTLYNDNNGMWVTGNGGGTVNVVNTTIAHNLSSGRPAGIAVQQVAAGTVVNIKNTILSDNYRDGTTSNCGIGLPVNPGTLVLPTSTGHNVSSDLTCGFTGSSNQSNVNVHLGILQYASGTYVVPITYQSPAFDRGTANGAPASDQRGVTRPQCNGVDIGAFETTACNATDSGDVFDTTGQDTSNTSGGNSTTSGSTSDRSGGTYYSSGGQANGGAGGNGTGYGGNQYTAYQQQGAGAGISELAVNTGQAAARLAQKAAGNPATWVITTILVAAAVGYASGHGGFWLGKHNRQLKLRRKELRTWLHKTRLRLRRYFALPK